MVKICETHLCILIAVYIARDSQQLSTPASISFTKEKFLDNVLSLPPTTDEHVYKMVQICMAMMEDNKQDMELHNLCLSACEIAINNKLII